MKRTVISNILVAVDGSLVSRKAAMYAVELANGLNASVTFISVIDNTAYTGRTVIPAAVTPTRITEPVEDYLRRAAEAFTSRLEKACEQRNVTAKASSGSALPSKRSSRKAAGRRPTSSWRALTAGALPRPSSWVASLLGSFTEAGRPPFSSSGSPGLRDTSKTMVF